VLRDTLLPDAKVPEHDIQQLLHIHVASDHTKVVGGNPQLLGCHVNLHRAVRRGRGGRSPKHGATARIVQNHHRSKESPQHPTGALTNNVSARGGVIEVDGAGRVHGGAGGGGGRTHVRSAPRWGGGAALSDAHLARP
jgi:hypothetical protein